MGSREQLESSREQRERRRKSTIFFPLHAKGNKRKRGERRTSV